MQGSAWLCPERVSRTHEKQPGYANMWVTYPNPEVHPLLGIYYNLYGTCKISFPVSEWEGNKYHISKNSKWAREVTPEMPSMAEITKAML